MAKFINYMVVMFNQMQMPQKKRPSDPSMVQKLQTNAAMTRSNVNSAKMFGNTVCKHLQKMVGSKCSLPQGDT